MFVIVNLSINIFFVGLFKENVTSDIYLVAEKYCSNSSRKHACVF